jgi:class 3 adenylate cyclase/tetratricopeptide (TPR) repeat protein
MEQGGPLEYAALVPVICQACGRENPDGFRFCGACGAELSEQAGSREVRKTVTVVFCDVTGSTALGERLDPEALRRTMGRYFEQMRLIVERHGGTVEKFVGDAVMAVFGIPVAHEDDALRAVRAVAEMRERLATLGEELSVALSFRTGVNTGEVVAGTGETLVTGDAVNVAARLEQAAASGEILISAETLALVRDAVSVEPVAPLELKGKSEPVAAFRLQTVDVTADAFKRHLDAPLVGRVREQQRLRADFEDVVSERACHLFTLLGAAGVGKSRLVAEFLAGAAGSADALRGRCLHYGDDITYWPLVEILLEIEVEPASVVGTSPAETQLAFRKLLEARAAERPQIVVLDDIQWAQSVFLDLVEHVADWSRDAPIFLLCIARPELLELRPDWGGGKLNATTVLLEALSGDDCELLISRLAGGEQLTGDVRRRILAAADGNPLFIEEMVALVSEDGGDSTVVVPPTIQALLQARLDRLDSGEREVVGRGAVEGQVFHRAPVLELAPERERADVSTHLLSLVRKELIRPDHPTFPDDEAFRFRHLLIRDAAYDSLPKETRADLHERFAAWLEDHATLVEQDEIVGYHLEQAHRNRAELDAADPRLEPLGRRAAGHLASAARGALERGDLGAARGLYTRAASLLAPGDSTRLGLLAELAWPLSEAGAFDEMRGIVDELASGEPRFQAFAELLRMDLEISIEPETRTRLGPIRRTLEAAGDELGLAWVEFQSFGISWSAMRAEEGREALARGAEHASRAGQRALAAFLGAWEGAALAFGPTPAEEVIRLTEDVLAHASGPLERAGPLRRLGRMLACRGEFERAREVYREGTGISREAGLLREAAAAAMGMAKIEQGAGDHDAAEAVLRAGMAELDALGDRNFYSTLVADLAALLADRGEYEEAAVLCARARETANPSDLATVAAVDALEGLLTARRGDHAEGERLARHGVELLADSDFYGLGAATRLWLARTLALVGKPAEAREVAAAALAIYEAKGDRPAAGWARELLDSLSS